LQLNQQIVRGGPAGKLEGVELRRELPANVLSREDFPQVVGTMFSQGARRECALR
jgi:hypothetical protein